VINERLSEAHSLLTGSPACPASDERELQVIQTSAFIYQLDRASLLLAETVPDLDAGRSIQIHQYIPDIGVIQRYGKIGSC